jgi:hypothetical protein
MSNLDLNLQILEDFCAIPESLDECQKQLKESRDYIGAALKAVEHHRRHEVVPPEIASQCHYLALMLNEDLAMTVGVEV